jgi:hypothetical protein
MRFYFRKVVQIFEIKRVGGAPKGHPFAPLTFDVLKGLYLKSGVFGLFEHA